MDRRIGFAAPLLLLAVAGGVYSYLNKGLNLFVSSLGAGCCPGFNTDWLTFVVALALLATAATACSLLSSRLSGSKRYAYLGACFVLLLMFYHLFMRYNLWE